MKKLHSIQRSNGSHWVGDGFPVRSLFSYSNFGELLSPFLLLDYAGPTEFPPTEKRLGVGEHPHRGFETVTIVYDGEVEHRDSSGGGGKIGPGDVQWMTAASGIVHEEFHGRDFARRGGKFEMVQLWVNLPAKDKMSQPHYQGIVASDIPQVSLGVGEGSLRVIAGEYQGVKGPAETYTPIQVWDIRLAAGQKLSLDIVDGFNAALVMLDGELRVNDSEEVSAAEVALFENAGEGINIEANQDSRLLLLAGEPLNEPIAGAGPFVMNTSAEIHQAMVDYQTGKMGHLS